MGTRVTWQADLFHEIDTENKAYWLGFIAADGCVHTSVTGQKKFAISQCEADTDHVKKFALFIDLGRQINIQKNLVARINLTSTDLYNDLVSQGICERKTLILKRPKKLRYDLIHHWIRGYFDGDGCVNIRKDGRNFRVIITSTRDVLEFISEQFPFEFIIHKNASVWSMRLNRQDRCRAFRDYIYESSTIYMDRKFNKFNEMEMRSGN